MTRANVRQLFIQVNSGTCMPGVVGFWYRCADCGALCGRPAHSGEKIQHGFEMEVGYITPKSDGGSDAPWNLKPLCKSCSKRAKSARRRSISQRG